MSRDELAADPILLSAVEHNLQIAIQASLDIGNILLAELDTASPGGYRDVFGRLAAVGVIPAGFAERIRPMAGFRNVLVQLYLDVDVGIVHEVLTSHLDDFDAFTTHVGAFLRQYEAARQ